MIYYFSIDDRITRTYKVCTTEDYNDVMKNHKVIKSFKYTKKTAGDVHEIMWKYLTEHMELNNGKHSLDAWTEAQQQTI